MRRFIKFNCLCLKEAWRDCWARANAAAGLLGAVLLWIVLQELSPALRQRGLIDAPTTYWGVAGLTAASAVASVALSFVVIFLIQLILAPARLYWHQRDRADNLDAQLRVIKAGNDELEPNWPIHEVFSHIEPDFLERPQDNLLEKAGDKIRDALSLGRLHIWGRPIKTTLGDWVGERASLRLIGGDYWQKAYFTYMFVDASASDAPHCYADRNTGVPAYTDLQVNRNEVMRLWPGEPSDVAGNYPNVRLADSPAILALFDGPERTKLMALLADEKLSSWARVSASTSSDFVRLSGSVWSNAKFRRDAKNDDDSGSINQTYLRGSHETTSAFYDVCMNFAQIKRAWPAIDIRRVKCDER